jgi:hypothetical protein
MTKVRNIALFILIFSLGFVGCKSKDVVGQKYIDPYDMAIDYVYEDGILKIINNSNKPVELATPTVFLGFPSKEGENMFFLLLKEGTHSLTLYDFGGEDYVEDIYPSNDNSKVKEILVVDLKPKEVREYPVIAVAIPTEGFSYLVGDGTYAVLPVIGHHEKRWITFIALSFLAEVLDKDNSDLYKKALALALRFIWVGPNDDTELKSIEKDLLQEGWSEDVISVAFSVFGMAREKARKHLKDITKIKRI